jgi:hypothetical protein
MNSSFECPVCSEDFNRSVRMPLVLLCGHTICQHCASELLDIKKSLVCPLDRKTDPRQLSQIPFSYTILDLIDHVSVMSSKIKFLSLPPEARGKELQKSLQEKHSTVSLHLEKINSILSKFMEMQSTICQSIDEKFESLHIELAVRQETLKSEVKQRVKELLASVLEVAKELEEMEKAIEKCLGDEGGDIEECQKLLGKALAEVPEVACKVKFTETSQDLCGLLRDWGRVRVLSTTVPINCEHFSNITYWMIPPCCNKYYCCNKCHDKKEEHPWIYANRMVCMHCELEQEYKKLPNECSECNAFHKGVISRS